jgi:RimJ/RimL family protein N-acetyltransferase
VSPPWPTAAVIETPRLRLTPLAVDDAHAMATVLSDPDLYQYTGGGPPSVETLENRYTHQVAGSGSADEAWLNWIVRLCDDRPVGFVQATLSSTLSSRRAELAWVVGTPWQGRGVASEAVSAMRTWLEGRGVPAFRACIHPAHIASQRVANNAGLNPTDDIEDGEVVWVG